MSYVELIAERESANDEAYTLVECLAKEGSKVMEGAAVASLEGSKAVVEINSPKTGYIFFLEKIGSIIEVGKSYAIINDSPKFDIKSIKENSNKEHLNLSSENNEILNKFTANAIKAIGNEKIDNKYFADMEIVTKIDVQNYFENINISQKSTPVKSYQPFNQKISGKQKIAVIGAGHAGYLVYDAIFKRDDQIIVCFFDNYKDNSHEIGGIKVSGLATPKNIYEEFKKKYFDAIVISPGIIDFRKTLFEDLDKLGVPFANVIHPTVEIGKNVMIGSGNVIFSSSIIGTETKIGNNNFIASRCNFEHHNIIGSHNNFGPSVNTSGLVNIGSKNIFGTGIFIEPKLTIGNDSTISSGSILQKNIGSNLIYKTKINSIIKEKT